MRVDVRIVADRRKKPRLDRPFAAHALDAPAALGEPDVAQTATKETALPLAFRDHSESTEPLIDHLSVDAFPVAGADELVAPAAQCR
jgi:hypothetical protein